MAIFLTVFLFLNIILCIANAVLFNNDKKSISLAFSIVSGFTAHLFMMLLVMESIKGG